MKKIYKYDLTFCHWLMTSWWRIMWGIFHILSIPDMFYYHVIIVKSPLVTLVTSGVTHSTHSIGSQNWPWIGLFPLLSISSFTSFNSIILPQLPNLAKLFHFVYFTPPKQVTSIAHLLEYSFLPWLPQLP